MLKKLKLKLKRPHWIGIIVSLTTLLIAAILLSVTDWFDKNTFYFIMGICFVVLVIPFILTIILESKKATEKEEMFLEFTRDLVEGVRAGTSISKSILNVRVKDYGSLTPHIDKLVNQISLGIPIRLALENFSNEVDNRVISRAITLITEAETAGGHIETILESVSGSVGQIEKLRKERRAAIYNLTVQGYIIFLIFIAILLVMQYKLLPLTSEIGGAGSLLKGDTESGGSDFGANLGSNLGGFNFGGEGKMSLDEMANSFLYLLIIQGFFAGLVIGKISEGSVKAGIKHSFILLSLAILISLGARAFLS